MISVGKEKRQESAQLQAGGQAHHIPDERGIAQTQRIRDSGQRN